MRTIQEEMKRLTDLHEGEFLSDSGSIEFLKVHQLARIADALEKMVPVDFTGGITSMTAAQYKRFRDRVTMSLKKETP